MSKQGVVSMHPDNVDLNPAEVSGDPCDGERMLAVMIARDGRDPFVWFMRTEVAAKVYDALHAYLMEERARARELDLGDDA